MINLKYIRFAGIGFVVFPDTLMHKDVAAAVGHRPVSAGFIMWSDNKPVCHGESLSLQLKHDPGDTQQLCRDWGVFQADNFKPLQLRRQNYVDA